MFRARAISLVLLGMLFLASCGPSTGLREIGSTFLVETDKATYYTIRYTSDKHSAIMTAIKRVEKGSGAVTYGEKAGQRMDQERLIRR